MEILSRSQRVCLLIPLLLLTACSGENIFGLGRTGVGERTGTIAGVVTGDGVPLGGVMVILVNGDSTQTNSLGQYRFEEIAAGTYSVTLRVPIGFVLGAGEEAIRTVVVTDRGTAAANWNLLSSIAAARVPSRVAQ